MTEAVQELLNTFDALTEPEKQEAAAQLLRRVIAGESDEMSVGVLVTSAEELFLELDAQEAMHGES